jgi:hypothetical protein
VKYWLLIFNNPDVMKSTNLYVLNFCVGRLSCMYVCVTFSLVISVLPILEHQ